MKKIFTTLCMASMLLTAYADMTLSLTSFDENEEEVITNITKDTTIVVTDFVENEFTGAPEMAVYGNVTTDSKSIKVTIERSEIGINDQFCLGTCVNGNGELKEELTLQPENNAWFTHYYPTTPSTVTIAYTFNDGINPAIKLTVDYNYSGTAVDNVVINPSDNTIYNLLGQRMPSNNLSELPAGIYIINGKKYIKQ